jgi:predicted signal transduction protein with EAL and GGDEF domain
MGDKLLVEVAQRLLQAVRSSDIVARLGGDEFVVVLPDMESPADAIHVAEKILTTVAQPYPVDGHELRTSPSIGICLYPEDANECHDLMKKADVAMYHAKAQGRRNYQFFTAEMQHAALKRIAIESELRIALKEQQFELHYQPQLDLRSGKISGFEALVRWHHPVRGMVSPIEFIPIAEESGLILPLGDWVLREACRQLAAWRARGIDGIRMSVNLSAHQFIDPHLPQRILQILDESGLAPRYLDLEVTESMSMRTPSETATMMEALTSHGMTLSIDDFGTGYSSLAYLKLFPISTLKIDRSFVSDIETDPSNAQICDVTVLLAHKLNLETVAEGVETEGQLKYLLSIGCEKIQGYFISKPLPAEAAETFLRGNPDRLDLGTVDLWNE